MPESGNALGFLCIALKTALENAREEDRDTTISHFKAIKTRGDAQRFIAAVQYEHLQNKS